MGDALDEAAGVAGRDDEGNSARGEEAGDGEEIGDEEETARVVRPAEDTTGTIDVDLEDAL